MPSKEAVSRRRSARPPSSPIRISPEPSIKVETPRKRAAEEELSESTVASKKIKVERDPSEMPDMASEDEDVPGMNDFTAFVQKYQKLKSDHAQQCAENEKLDFENEKLRAEIAQIKAANVIQQTNDMKLQSDYNNLQRQNIILQSQIDDVEAESRVTAELAKTDEEDHDELKKEHDELKKKLENVVNCNKMLVQKDLAWLQECNRVSHFARYWEAEVRDLAQRFANYKNRVKALGEEN